MPMFLSNFISSTSIFGLFKRSNPVREPNPPEPRAIEWLLAHRNRQDIHTTGETPTASLYRMYEYIVISYNIGLRTEIEWFFNHPDWAVSAIPDPKDPDPARYAILAVIPHFLVAAFNRLIEKGLPRGSPAIIIGDDELDELQSKRVVLEELPSWVTKVPKLSETLVIPNADNNPPDEQHRSHRFFDMNIVVSEPHVMFV